MALLSDADARERVRVARALTTLPAIGAAFGQGRLSYSKARAMTGVASAANESVLLDVALNGTAHHVETLVRRYRRARRDPRCRYGPLWLAGRDDGLASPRETASVGSRRLAR